MLQEERGDDQPPGPEMLSLLYVARTPTPKWLQPVDQALHRVAPLLDYLVMVMIVAGKIVNLAVNVEVIWIAIDFSGSIHDII